MENEVNIFFTILKFIGINCIKRNIRETVEKCNPINCVSFSSNYKKYKKHGNFYVKQIKSKYQANVKQNSSKYQANLKQIASKIQANL